MEDNDLTFLSGWNLHLPADGFLFRERNVDPVGVLLPDDRDIVDLRGEKVLRLRASDDGNPIEQVLVHMLGSARADHHARKYRVRIIRSLTIDNIN